jgi:parallel beta-helix repeat protein
MLRKLSVVLFSAGALALGACSSTSGGDGGTPPPANLCAAVPTGCTAFPAGTTEATISADLNTATANSTFIFGTGTFSFTNSITLSSAAGITIAGQGIGNTILDFTNQAAGTAGISATNNQKLTFTKFTIQNTPGDAIKVEGGNGVIFQTMQATWTNPSPITHGAYGIYPVQSQSILVDSCQVSGARDTGIYVGQSFNIIVRNNTVKNNVAGIEIESSVNADVYGNNATANAGGILIFALPNLSPPPGSGQPNDGTTNVRVFNNMITANNTLNFGDPSGTVAAVPSGTGSFVLAGNNVEIFQNIITDNDSVGFAVASYFIIAPPGWDPTPGGSDNPTGLDPFAHNIYVHDNTFTNNGTAPISSNESPDGGESLNPLGALLGLIIEEGGFPSTNKIPDLIWDGIGNETAPVNYMPPTAPTNSTSAGTPPNPSNYFIASIETSTFANLNFPVLVPGGDVTALNVTAIVTNEAPFLAASAPDGFPLPGVDAGVIP